MNYADADPTYILKLGVVRKDLQIVTDPPVDITVDGEPLGTSPLTRRHIPFPLTRRRTSGCR